MIPALSVITNYNEKEVKVTFFLRLIMVIKRLIMQVVSKFTEIVVVLLEIFVSEYVQNKNGAVLLIILIYVSFVYM